MNNFNRKITYVVSGLFFLICFAFNSVHSGANALENTRWKGTVYAGETIEAVFEFKKDTLVMRYEGAIIETMSYQADATTMTIKKLSGGSPCGYESGQYKYAINHEVLILSVIKDECSARYNSFSTDGYKKL